MLLYFERFERLFFLARRKGGGEIITIIVSVGRGGRMVVDMNFK